MVSPSDFIHLEYTQDLTQAGVSLTGRSLTKLRERGTSPTIPGIRNQVAGISLALAFARFIDREKIPRQYLKTTPFSAPEHREVTIGGRRCTLIHTLITPKKQIRKANQNPGVLLEAKAILPNSQRFSSSYHDDDLYIFGFLFGLITPNLRSVQRAQNAKQHLYLIYNLPSRWQNLEKWQSLGELVVKNGSNHAINLQICGKNAGRGYHAESIHLTPGERHLVFGDFYTVSNLQTDSLPDGIVGIHSPVLAKTCLIRPVDWGNIWIYGTQIILVGYLTCGEYWKQATPVTTDRQIFQSHLGTVTRHGIPVAGLDPLPNLFFRAKTWRNS